MAQTWSTVSIEFLKARSYKTPEETMRRESEFLTARMQSCGRAVAVTPEGRQYDTAGFSRWMERHDGKEIVFAIGGTFGLDTKVKDTCMEKLSLSGLTFSHDLALCVLAEQIYRAYTILKGHPYHKE
jgi:23S rRNA (pseudouridine1915-N3)-methyltransferase